MRKLRRPRGGAPFRLPRAGAWLASTAAAATVIALGLAPGAGAITLMRRSASVARDVARRPPPVPAQTNGRLFRGNPAVGALFTYAGGQIGSHFCTASVVDSAHKDLLITAAHCVTGLSASRIAYVPEYHDGKTPYGVWTVSRIVADRAWRLHKNPNHDFAFLVVHQSGNPTRIQDLTGGDRLGTNWRQPVWAHVVGYPDPDSKPIVCQGRTRAPRLPGPARKYDSTQMEFDCGGYADGTSGGPFLARYSYRTRQGTVIGVIGGYEQGGDITSVSYSARFGAAMTRLYETAVRHS